jgi:vacuolar-type H+-ATPase catalytic subunit A/Vma1
VTALDDKLAEQARITAELRRMEEDDDITEEGGGADLRDTLIKRWKQLDEECKPIIARMQEIQQITRLAADEANLERPDSKDGTSASRFGSPDLVTANRGSPYDCQDAIRHETQILMTRTELAERAKDAVELEAKRFLSHDAAEEVTRKIQDYGWTRDNNIARHVLLTGTPEYQETFEAYLNNPQQEAQRAALSLTLANGGYLLPFVLDQVPVA